MHMYHNTCIIMNMSFICNINNITYETGIHFHTCIVIQKHILNYNYFFKTNYLILLYGGHRYKVRTKGATSKKGWEPLI